VCDTARKANELANKCPQSTPVSGLAVVETENTDGELGMLDDELDDDELDDSGSA
jgi:hypothetical protein